MKNRTINTQKLFENKTGKLDNAPIVIAYKIKTPENLGNIIRLSDNAGVKRLIIVTDEENIRESKIRKTAGLSFQSMHWEVCSTKEIFKLIPDEYQIVALETSSDSKNIFDLQLPEKMAIFVGNEVVGLDNAVLDKSHIITHIPMKGHNVSMNVSHALTVALFEWIRQNEI